MFGDFEAQRHWVEVTSGLPLRDWYVDGPQNNLTYWGLDYPPLTAYHAYMVGWLARQRLNDAHWRLSFGVEVSHGAEGSSTVEFMKESLLWTDITVYFSGAFVVAVLFAGLLETSSTRLEVLDSVASDQSEARVQALGRRKRWRVLPMTFMVLLCAPCALLYTDYAHFQYNCASLGFFLWVVYFAARDIHETSVRGREAPLSWTLKSIVALVLSVAFKQMSLYFCLGCGVWYFAKCIRCGYADSTGSALVFSKVSFVKAVVLCAATGVGSLIAVTAPFIVTGTLPNVVQRVFPVGRGLFEDKLANFWCCTSIVFKPQRFLETVVLPSFIDAAPRGVYAGLSKQIMALVCVAAIVVTSLPSLRAVISAARPIRAAKKDDHEVFEMGRGDGEIRLEGFLWMLFATSLSFYLFGYQVHEKSILLPLMPATLLMAFYEHRDASLSDYAHVQRICEESQVAKLKQQQTVEREEALRALCTRRRRLEFTAPDPTPSQLDQFLGSQQRMWARLGEEMELVRRNYGWLWVFNVASVASLHHLATKDRNIGIFVVLCGAALVCCTYHCTSHFLLYRRQKGPAVFLWVMVAVVAIEQEYGSGVYSKFPQYPHLDVYLHMWLCFLGFGVCWFVATRNSVLLLSAHRR
jgi:hypothetical protein